MNNLKKNHILFSIVCLVFGLFVFCALPFAQEKSNEDLQKEYAPILGEYEFVTEGQTTIIRFYIEGGELWADSGDGRPATLEPVEDEVFSFTAEDPISGMFEIEFLKDDQGEYAICHIVNTSMGLEIEGTKIR
ncbi:MAG: hypothetical protein JSV17_12225 [Candidatus Aminicenantes bacterium]|nr:MAG: hypothetical protein JSV17_12225 [Candidatus Aminicenantes bacterium]